MTGRRTAITIDPPYAAPLARPGLIPLLFVFSGSTLIFKFREVDVVDPIRWAGPAVVDWMERPPFEWIDTVAG